MDRDAVEHRAEHCTDRRPVVLVIEDDSAARALVARVAGAEGFAVLEAPTGRGGLALLRARPVDVVVLDLGLPDRDGFALLGDIRRASVAPTIVVSGDARLESRITGLRLGADDYVVKPVTATEIGARVAAAARRARAHPSGAAADIVRFGDFGLDLAAHELRDGDTVVTLTRREHALLVCLASQPRRAFTRAQLLEQAWGDREWHGEATVTEHVRTLRRKLREPMSAPRWIVTVRGVGYRFDP